MNGSVKRDTYSLSGILTYWQARLIECEEGAGDYKGFITSLTEPESYPAEALRYVYQERWSIENGYGELKQF